MFLRMRGMAWPGLRQELSIFPTLDACIPRSKSHVAATFTVEHGGSIAAFIDSKVRKSVKRELLQVKNKQLQV